jgi:hypothetical protein
VAGVLAKLAFTSEAAAEKGSATLAQSLTPISNLLEAQKTADTGKTTRKTKIELEKTKRERNALLSIPLEDSETQ